MYIFFFFKQKTAYEMRISDWSSDVCSSDLLVSLGHLGKPLRAWRAFSQWRTSWLSREGVMSIATLLPALAVGALLWRGEPGPATATLLAVSGLVLALCALATVACTAMIYASLKPIPAWRHPLVLPGYLPFPLLTGLALLVALLLAMLDRKSTRLNSSH